MIIIIIMIIKTLFRTIRALCQTFAYPHRIVHMCTRIYRTAEQTSTSTHTHKLQETTLNMHVRRLSTLLKQNLHLHLYLPINKRLDVSVCSMCNQTKMCVCVSCIHTYMHTYIQTDRQIDAGFHVFMCA